jgi:endonuclease/exonuclease/phosphatase family metal-dependent hydrolase
MENCKVIINDSTTNSTLRIGTFNLANSLLDEKSETTNFFVREGVVLDAIKKMNCDVLGLNELRPYRNRMTGETCQPSNFLGKLEGYAHIYDYMSADPLAFAIGLAYRRSSVYPVKTVKYWLSETPEIPSDSWGNGFCRILLGAKFYPVVNGKINLSAKPIWIYVTHLGLGEKEKNECVKLIPKLINKDVGTDHYAVLGDFNFFDDKDGQQQRRTLSDAGMKDVGAQTYFSFDTTKRCYGTFLGFDGDAFKSTYESLSGLSDKVPSRLDHIWVSPFTEVSDVTCWVEKEEQLINRTTPSDHLPLLCTIKL